MSVFQNLDCLSLVVCSNTTLLKNSDCVVFIFFQILHFEIGGAAYLWMRLIHGRLRYFLPANRDEVFIWQNFQPAYRDPGWKNQASPPSHMNTSKFLQRIKR